MNLPSSIDVLIVGAGPTGLMLANQLVRHGLTPLIIDKNSGPSVHSKALGVQARTLEIYAQLGIADKAVELGKKANGANVWVSGKRAARLPLGDIGKDLSPFPFLLVLSQDENERLLGDALRERGTEVHWNTELAGLEQQADQVSVTLKNAEGNTFEVKAKWVAGCDGARSAVRSLNDIDFQGAPYEHVFFVADTQVTGPMLLGELNIFLWRERFHLFFPMRGTDHWRVVGILPAELRGRTNLDFESVRPSLSRETGSSIAFGSCNWFSTYRIHHRRAARFRERRCFLLGDAAHIHSPVGAQGMNTGLQDAYNLGWKLALVGTGRASASLLDSYESERIPVANRLLQTTDRAFSLIVSDHWLAGLFRTKIVSKLAAFAMRQERVRRFAFRTIAQVNIAYPDSSLSQNLSSMPSGAPVAGDRFPWMKFKFSPDAPPEDLFARLDDLRFNLIVVGQSPLPADGGEINRLVLTHHIQDDPHNRAELRRLGIPHRAFYLLRPDGHIGLAGSDLTAEALRQYLSKIVELSTL